MILDLFCSRYWGVIEEVSSVRMWLDLEFRKFIWGEKIVGVKIGNWGRI